MGIKQWMLAVGILVNMAMSSTTCDVGNNPMALVAGWSSFTVDEWRQKKNIKVFINPDYTELKVNYAEEEFRVSTQPFHRDVVGDIKSFFTRLSGNIPLRFSFVDSQEYADVLIFGACRVTNQNRRGIVADSQNGQQQLIILNVCLDITSQEFNQLFLHELGHVLGLKHPFDDATGMCLYTNKPYADNSATLEDTIMAYKAPENDFIPEWYRPLDLQALDLIWKQENSHHQSVLKKLRQATR